MTLPIDQLLDAVEWTAIPRDKPEPADGNCSLRCFTLNDGQRVFDAEDVAKFFGVEVVEAPISKINKDGCRG